jgi:hypothetical protein
LISFVFIVLYFEAVAWLCWLVGVTGLWIPAAPFKGSVEVKVLEGKRILQLKNPQLI